MRRNRDIRPWQIVSSSMHDVTTWHLGTHQHTGRSVDGCFKNITVKQLQIDVRCKNCARVKLKFTDSTQDHSLVIKTCNLPYRQRTRTHTCCTSTHAKHTFCYSYDDLRTSFTSRQPIEICVQPTKTCRTAVVLSKYKQSRMHLTWQHVTYYFPSIRWPYS